jgi:hypothetical protein
MLITGATSATKRPQGPVVAGKFAAAALVIFLGFAGFFATAQRAGADTGIPASGATGAMADSAAGVPPGSTTAVPPPVAGNGAPEAPVDISQPTAQDATTAQAATADAAATQPEQSNTVGTTRVDSSGDEGASQQNGVSVVGAAANGASTSQTAGSGPPPADGTAAEAQQAATDQAANAAAAAVQPQQSNVVIIIRINSPGDDVVTQTNVVSVVAVGANQSSTSQNSGLPGPSAAGTSDPSPNPTGADGQAADGQAAPSPNAAQQPPQQAPAQAPAAVEQPAQSVDAARQQRPDALAILATSGSSTATRQVPDSQRGSPTRSANHLRRGGVRGRSDASASRTVVALQSGRSSANSTPVGKADPQADSTVATPAPKAQASWLSQPRLAPESQIAANVAGYGTNFLPATLAALLVGLLGWAALTWFRLARGSPWRGA